MSEKVIILSNKEEIPQTIRRIKKAGVKTICGLGKLIITEEMSPAQETELASHGIVVKNLKDVNNETVQLSEEDSMLLGAYRLRKTEEYQSLDDGTPSEEAEMMSEIDCGHNH